MRPDGEVGAEVGAGQEGGDLTRGRTQRTASPDDGKVSVRVIQWHLP